MNHAFRVVHAALLKLFLNSHKQSFKRHLDKQFPYELYDFGKFSFSKFPHPFLIPEIFDSRLPLESAHNGKREALGKTVRILKFINVDAKAAYLVQ